MTRYLVMAMRRPSFDDAVIAPHLAFLEELRAMGQLEMTGGFSDSSGGAYVLVNVSSLDEARAATTTAVSLARLRISRRSSSSRCPRARSPTRGPSPQVRKRRRSCR